MVAPMPLSILHISDLHRDPANPIRNEVLLHSLENDRGRYTKSEEPAIRSPDLIIVSGDIVQGVAEDAKDPENDLRQQYKEALEFLAEISKSLTDGDRERVILVPGNHDVSSHHFRKSLSRISIPPDRKRKLVAELFDAGSSLRWSWSTLELFKITDSAMYAQRMAAYAEFYEAFYEGKRRFDLAPEKQFDVFDFPQHNITVVGFSSCWDNDLFNRQAAVNPACIAEAGRWFRKPANQDRLRVAVWHHNTEGAPNQSDYMDPEVLQNLIDAGYSLGFHGHQHRPQFLDTRFRHGPERRVTVISAGTLCGDGSYSGGRAYNIVEINLAERTGRLFVRRMQNSNLGNPIWGRHALPPNTSPFQAFKYDPPPEPFARAAAGTLALAGAQECIERGEYRKAADLLRPVIALEPLARPILLSCLIKLPDYAALIEIFDPPSSAAEAIHLMDALWANHRRERLTKLMTLPIIADAKDASVVEIRDNYKRRLKQ